MESLNTAERDNSIPATDTCNDCKTIRNTSSYLPSNSDYTTSSQAEAAIDNQSRVMQSNNPDQPEPVPVSNSTNKVTLRYSYVTQ